MKLQILKHNKMVYNSALLAGVGGCACLWFKREVFCGYGFLHGFTIGERDEAPVAFDNDGAAILFVIASLALDIRC